MEGRDVIAGAQTGTGKTGAFAIPIIHKLSGTRGLRALILAPTRELAVQIQEAFDELGRESRVVSIPVYGGVSIEPQISARFAARCASGSQTLFSFRPGVVLMCSR